MADSDPTPRPQDGSSASAPAKRLVSIDVFRGMVMLQMLAEVMHLDKLAEHFPGNRLFESIRIHTTHVAWEGCSLYDLIQPGFTFLVGTSMLFSIASRLGRGGSTARLLLHAAWRAVVLILLGIVLRSLRSEQTYFSLKIRSPRSGSATFSFS